METTNHNQYHSYIIHCMTEASNMISVIFNGRSPDDAMNRRGSYMTSSDIFYTVKTSTHRLLSKQLHVESDYI